MNTTTCLLPSFSTKTKNTVLSTEITSSYDIQLYKTISDVDIRLWQTFIPDDWMFLQREFLHAFEEVSNDLEFRYALISNGSQPIGFISLQVLTFKGSNIAGAQDEEGAAPRKFWQRILVRLANAFSFRLLVAGNTFMSGEYGIYFAPSVAVGLRVQILEQAIQEALASLKKVGGIVVKDFYLNTGDTVYHRLQNLGYLQQEVQPNMVVPIRPYWKSFQDYLADMKSKYRVRMKKAVKMAQNVETSEMTYEEVLASIDRLKVLYQDILNQTRFKMGVLDIRHVERLLKYWPDNFKLIGYRLNGELIGFMSIYHTNDDLVAGMMGLDRKYLHGNDLYLRMLLDIVDRAIQLGVSNAGLGRTAMEIKSSIGAEPHEMYFYVKHKTGWKNRIIKPIIRAISKQKDWQQRHPFKMKS